MLNPKLFKALQVCYGDEVTVKNEGETADYKRVVKKVVLRNGKTINRVRYEAIPGGRYGEKYVMDCPFCGDRKKRFSVSYLFACKDNESGQYMKSGLHCFNETECHRSLDNREEFFDRLQLAMDYGVASSIGSVEFHESSREASEVGEKPLPGYCVSICDLPENHTTNQYLIDRGFDPAVAGEVFGASLIVQPSSWSLLKNRLLIPFNRNGSLIGWCARAVNQEDFGRKYVNSSGGLGGFLYGLRGALSCKVLCLVEGCFDRWAVGRPGAGLLTATLGYTKQQRLQEAIMCSEVELVVVLVDPKQPEKSKADGHPHQMDVLTQHLKKCLSPIPILPVWLPQWLDPGACHGDYLANYLRVYLKEHGYERYGEVLARDVQSSSATCTGLR